MFACNYSHNYIVYTIKQNVEDFCYIEYNIPQFYYKNRLTAPFTNGYFRDSM